MPKLVRATTYLAAALVVAACSSGSPAARPSSSPASAASPPASTVAATAPLIPAPSVAPSAAASPTVFTSKTYGYSVMLPAGWTGVQATAVWNGTGAPGSDTPEGDRFLGPAAPSSWALVTPKSKDLAGYAKEWVDATAKYHGDTCTAPPEAVDPIMIGSEPATLLSFNCGILINGAVTVHKGIGYQFGFRDPSVQAATDPADRMTFLELLRSVQFPD
ncbi:MAG TPA: hypothetical protein VHM48_09460 [Candidatus Limnocylindrales bacterium]|nr:hypothetical protein [Candidatus Limnocylindrales bacterium]